MEAATTEIPRYAGIVIAGAGIAGIATAHYLAEAGFANDVLLVDPRPPLTLTSDKTGANYRDWWPRREMVELASRSIELMEALARSGGQFAMNQRGYLYVTGRSPAALHDLARTHERAGAGPVRRHESGATYQPSAVDEPGGARGADLLDAPLLARCYPHLAPGLTAAIHARRAGSMDTRGLGHELLARASGRGVRLVRGEITGVHATDSGLRSVTIAAGRKAAQVETRRFINAAGPFAASVAALAGAVLPLETVLQQKVLLADPHGVIPPDAPFTICLDPMKLEWTAAEQQQLGASPRTRRWLETLPGGLHIKPDRHGEQAVVKLGWAFNDDPEEPRWEPSCPPAYPRLVLLAASRIVPALATYLPADPIVVSHDGGYYVKAPDDLPLIGPCGPEGMFVVGGLAGFGAMVSCAAGEMAAALVTGSRPQLAGAFMPSRFRERRGGSRVPASTSGAL